MANEETASDESTESAVEFLRKCPTAFLSDVYKKIGLDKDNLTAGELSPLKEFTNTEDGILGSAFHIAGPAVTMRFVPATEAELYTDLEYKHTDIVENADPGSVIVIDGQGAPYGYWGKNANLTAIRENLEGVVIDGYTRDVRPVKDANLPVFCTGTTMNSYVRQYDLVGYNDTVNVDGATIHPGDMIVGDNDGVVVVPQTHFDEILEEAKNIVELEEDMTELVEESRSWNEDIYPTVHKQKYTKD